MFSVFGDLIRQSTKMKVPPSKNNEPNESHSDYSQKVIRSTAAAAIQTAFRNTKRKSNQETKGSIFKFKCASLFEKLLPSWFNHLPLLNVVFGTDFADNDYTKSLTDEQRRDETLLVLFELMKVCNLTCDHVVIFLEDIHTMDGSSWKLVNRILEEIPAILFFTTARQEISLKQTLNAKQAVVYIMQLEPPKTSEIKQLIAQSLGVSVEQIPAKCFEMIIEKSNGNPLFSEALARNLVDLGILEISPGVCTFHANAVNTLSFPDSIQAVVTNRLDKLPPIEQVIVINYMKKKRYLYIFSDIDKGGECHWKNIFC